MNYTRGVSIYILNDENQVLMLMHKKLKCWMPPGGSVEENELVHQAAIREVFEETGLEIEFICEYIDENKTLDERAELLPMPFVIELEKGVNEDYIYLSKAVTEEIDNKENHVIKWFDIDEALELDAFENVKKHLRYIRKKLGI